MLEDGWRLDIQCKFKKTQSCILFFISTFYSSFLHFSPIDIPETKVRLGTPLDPEAVREGTDLYFDCIVNSHPPIYKIEWRHNVIINNLS